MKKALLAMLVACCAFAYEDLDNSNVSAEIGIGYLNSSFTGKQSGIPNAKGSARGVDMYAAINTYATERFGISFGMGAEFVNGSWNDECSVGGSSGIGAYSYTIEVLKYSVSRSTQAKKEQEAALKERFGDGWNTTAPLYKDTITQNKYEYHYENVGAGKGDYEQDNASATGYKYVGSGNGTHTKEVRYGFENKGANQGAYTRNTEGKGSVKGTDGNTYDYVGEGQGEYAITQETADLYKYSINNTGLSCTTPKLNAKTWYMFLGAFFDVVQTEYFGMRVFGNIGVGYDMMKDKFSRAVSFYDGGSYEMYYTYNSNQTPSQEKGSVFMPLTAGLRFIIWGNHGIELVGKYNLVKSKWKSTQTLYQGAYNGKDEPTPISIDTKIIKDYSWGIRYVYEFK